MKPLRTFSSPLADMVAMRPYTDMPSMFDEVWPPGRLYYHKASNIRDLSDAAIETLLEYAAPMPAAVSSIYLMQYVHGAASRVAVSETAFPHRYDHYSWASIRDGRPSRLREDHPLDAGLLARDAAFRPTGGEPQ